MAEETHLQDYAGSDDVAAIRTVLMSVKGSSPISLAPMLETVSVDDYSTNEQFEFE